MILRWVAICFSCAAFLFFFQVYPNYINPNESCRLLLISAMVDDHVFEIDRAMERYGDTQDKSVYNGHFYTAKPIGYSLVAAPVYLLITKISRLTDPAMIIWVLRFFVNLIPLLLFTLFLFDYAKKKIGIGNRSYVLVVAFLFGTLYYPYAQLFMAHVLTGVLWFLAFWCIAEHDEPQWGFLGGALLGFAFVMEILTIVALGVCGIYLLIRKRRMLLLYAAGAVLLSLPAFLSNYAIFADPFKWTYQHTVEWESQRNNQHGAIGLTLPTLRIFWELTFGTSRGFFYHMPQLLFGAAGLFLERRNRPEALLALGIVFGNIFLMSGVLGWDGGWSFGPRYLVPIIPFLIYGTALWFRQLSNSNKKNSSIAIYVYLILLAINLPIILFGSVTFPFSPRFLPNPVLWENFTLFWRGFFGLNIGEVFGFSELWIQLIGIALITVPAVLFVCMSDFVPRQVAVFVCVLVICFSLSAGLQKVIQDRTDYRHCFSIGRAGYIQANYGKSLEFLHYARQRNPDPGLKNQIDIYREMIVSKFQASRP